MAVPATTVPAARRLQTGDSDRPVGVRYNTNATSTSHGANAASPTIAASAAHGSAPGRANTPYTA